MMMMMNLVWEAFLGNGQTLLVFRVREGFNPYWNLKIRQAIGGQTFELHLEER